MGPAYSQCLGIKLISLDGRVPASFRQLQDRLDHCNQLLPSLRNFELPLLS